MNGSFLKDPWMVLGDVFLDVSKPNILVYKFVSYNIIFIMNEHVKPDKTCIDTQGHFKVNLSNVMDVLRRLISKLQKT